MQKEPSHKMKLFFIISITALLTWCNAVQAAIFEESPIPQLNIIAYHTVSESVSGDVVTRNISVEVSNNTETIIQDLSIKLDGKPSDVSASAESLIFHDVDPGSSKVSENTITLTYNRNQLQPVQFVWQAVFTFNGEKMLDETAVEESFK